MQLACQAWRRLSHDTVESWNGRAVMLNARPLAGRFLAVPEHLVNGDLLEVHVRESLACDWAKMVSILRNAITRAPKREISSKTVCFGGERVRVLSQTYRRHFVNVLLRYALFGKDDIKLGPGEVIYRSKKVTIIHFASLQRLKDVFTLAGLCGVEFHNVLNGNHHACCGKVSTMLRGRSMVGYIIGEGRAGKWVVQMGNNEKVKLQRLIYNHVSAEYIYPNISSVGGEIRSITHYWPVRVLIHTSGECKITLNRITFDSDTNIVTHLSS